MKNPLPQILFAVFVVVLFGFVAIVGCESGGKNENKNNLTETANPNTSTTVANNKSVTTNSNIMPTVAVNGKCPVCGGACVKYSYTQKNPDGSVFRIYTCNCIPPGGIDGISIQFMPHVCDKKHEFWDK